MQDFEWFLFVCLALVLFRVNILDLTSLLLQDVLSFYCVIIVRFIFLCSSWDFSYELPEWWWVRGILVVGDPKLMFVMRQSTLCSKVAKDRYIRAMFRYIHLRIDMLVLNCIVHFSPVRHLVLCLGKKQLGETVLLMLKSIFLLEWILVLGVLLRVVLISTSYDASVRENRKYLNLLTYREIVLLKYVHCFLQQFKLLVQLTFFVCLSFLECLKFLPFLLEVYKGLIYFFFLSFNFKFVLFNLFQEWYDLERSENIWLSDFLRQSITF